MGGGRGRGPWSGAPGFAPGGSPPGARSGGPARTRRDGDGAFGQPKWAEEKAAAHPSCRNSLASRSPSARAAAWSSMGFTREFLKAM